MPKIKYKNTAFYHNKKAINFDFTAEAVSSDAGVLLLSKIERKHKLVKSFSSLIPDYRNPDYVVHTYQKQLEQRVFMMAQGYEDCNDSEYLKDDPVLTTLLNNGLCSQPTLSRFENNMDSKTIYRLCEWWVNNYVQELSPENNEIVIDVDTTDDPTHGNQQLSMFHGYYWQWMYQELLFLDGKTGQMILPVLLPGTMHPSKPFVSILERIVERIKTRFTGVSITIRADAGFSSPSFYLLAEKHNLRFCLGLSANEVLKNHVKSEAKKVEEDYLEENKKHQMITGPFMYKAETWEKKQKTYAKIESTGIGMNIRYFVSNMEALTGEQIYYDFYVLRGETCENRIKEIKNMCFSDRLSCESYWANFFRLMLSGIVYEFFRIIKELIAKTSHSQAKTWLVNNIRLFLLKVGATVVERARSIQIRFSKAFAQQELFGELILLC
ncbi:IS1380 family transposase [Bacteroidales bacterium AH-315-N07]|nr:IS1380 family transposase [Bacteroidales bacterium AH-315-N07]